MMWLEFNWTKSKFSILLIIFHVFVLNCYFNCMLVLKKQYDFQFYLQEMQIFFRFYPKM
jgi:hypothetical protein